MTMIFWCSIRCSGGSEKLAPWVFESTELSKGAKILVYNAMILPTLAYGTESWVLHGREKQ